MLIVLRRVADPPEHCASVYKDEALHRNSRVTVIQEKMSLYLMRHQDFVDAGWRALLQDDGNAVPEDNLLSDTNVPGIQDGLKYSSGADFIMCLLPVAFVICFGVVAVLVPQARVRLRFSRALPLGAAMMWFIRLAYLKADTQYTNSVIVYGLLNSLKPLSMALGAISLVQTMEVTKV